MAGGWECLGSPLLTHRKVWAASVGWARRALHRSRWEDSSIRIIITSSYNINSSNSFSSTEVLEGWV